jgi:hypothetical protein
LCFEKWYNIAMDISYPEFIKGVVILIKTRRENSDRRWRLQ